MIYSPSQAKVRKKNRLFSYQEKITKRERKDTWQAQLVDNIHYRHVTDSISTLLKHRPENKECRQPLAFSLGVKKFSSTTPYPQRKQNKFLKDFHTVRIFFQMFLFSFFMSLVCSIFLHSFVSFFFLFSFFWRFCFAFSLIFSFSSSLF